MEDLDDRVNAVRSLAFQLSRAQLQWPASTPPQYILIVCKEGVEGEAEAIKDFLLNRWPSIRSVECCPSGRPLTNLLQVVDLVITVGGDGTVLAAAWFFQKTCPPILPLFHGTLGFLTVASSCLREPLSSQSVLAGCSRVSMVDLFKECFEGHLRINIRMRLVVRLQRAPSCNKIGEQNMKEPLPFDSEWTLLNEMVLDRGPSPHMAHIHLEVLAGETAQRQEATDCSDGEDAASVLSAFKVPGDGLVIGTPTGSTAYSVSAGGSLVHPDVAGILVTPICPHSLSMRPLILPDWMVLRVRLPVDSNRSEVLWLSFDGRERIQVAPGDSITVRASPYPVSTVCSGKGGDSTGDWLRSLNRCLAWNTPPK